MIRSLLVLALIVGCSHDTDRANPVDPQLTPSVFVSAALDSSSGAVTLTWTPYEGDTPFAGYRVLRNEVDRVASDTLASLAEVGGTSFVDTELAPDTAYEYRVEVANSAGYAAASNAVRVDGFTLRAVTLAGVDPDPVSGAIALRWSRFRDPGFQSYELLRRIVGTDQDERLVLVTTASDTTFSDTSARHGVSYVYRVVVHAAGRQLDGGAATGRLDLPVVEDLSVGFSSANASAMLSWATYQGPHFSHYDIQRRTGDDGFRSVHRSENVDSTFFVDDDGLHGSRAYSYRVVVVTTRGEEVASTEGSGQFHELVDSWPIDLIDGGFVRLYRESAGQISALVSTESSVRLLSYTVDGSPAGESVLFDLPASSGEQPTRIVPGSVSTVLAGERRLLALGQTNRHLLLEQSREGETIYRDTVLFSVELNEAATLADGVSFSRGRFDFNSTSAGFTTILDNLQVFDGSQTVLEEDFDGDTSGWDVKVGGDNSSESVWAPGVLVVSTNVLYVARPDIVATGMAADLWLGPDAEVGMTLGEHELVADNVTLVLAEAGQISLASTEWPNPIIRSVPFPLLAWIRYRPSLHVEQGRAVATLSHPRLLSYTDVEAPSFGAVALVADRAVFTVGGQRNAVGLDGSQPRSEALGTPTSDIRTWDIDDTTFMGYCLPDHNRVVVGRPSVSGFSGVVTWPQEAAASSAVLGTGAGQEDGELFFPLSLDRGPDGRYFVVDAGNARIQVFDAEGQYLTQVRGDVSEDGGFDFGSGNVSTDFTGSVVVDDEGFIYVADVGNRRILKFAP